MDGQPQVMVRGYWLIEGTVLRELLNELHGFAGLECDDVLKSHGLAETIVLGSKPTHWAITLKGDLAGSMYTTDSLLFALKERWSEAESIGLSICIKNSNGEVVGYSGWIAA